MPPPGADLTRAALEATAVALAARVTAHLRLTADPRPRTADRLPIAELRLHMADRLRTVEHRLRMGGRLRTTPPARPITPRRPRIMAEVELPRTTAAEAADTLVAVDIPDTAETADNQERHSPERRLHPGGVFLL
jgi:hypothetical protein